MLDARLEWPRLAGLLLATAIALAMAHSVYRIPIQVGDSLEVIRISRHAESSVDLFRNASGWSPTTLRPMRYLQARWLSQLADGLGLSYHVVFRGAHALLVLAIVGLLTWIARVRRWTDVAALGLALTVLVGLHTFDAMMRESFPVNHFAEVAAASLFVLGGAMRPPSVLRELTAIALLSIGLLLIESAVLIWFVIVSCTVLRLPGLRWPTAVAATTVLVLFVIARVMLDISAPGIGSHSSGWGAVTLSGEELTERFAASPLPFYIYNVIGGALSLLLSEPRFGVYQFLAAGENGSVPPVAIINLASSGLVTIAIALRCRTALATRVRTWDNDQKALAVGVGVIAASALLCATYIKDDIISTAGVFYAVMAYVAARWVLDQADTSRSLFRMTALALCLTTAASLWAFRAVGTHYDLRRSAFTSRNDWALENEQSLAGGESASQADVALARQLRREALNQPVTSPSFLPDWGERYWLE